MRSFLLIGLFLFSNFLGFSNSDKDKGSIVAFTNPEKISQDQINYFFVKADSIVFAKDIGAIQYVEKAIELSDFSKDESHTIWAKLLVAKNYASSGIYDEAESYISEITPALTNQKNNLLNIKAKIISAEIEAGKGDFTLAINLFNEVYQNIKTSEEKDLIFYTLGELTKISLSSKDTLNAISFLDKTYNQGIRFNNSEKIARSNFSMAKLHEALAEEKLAFEKNIIASQYFEILSDTIHYIDSQLFEARLIGALKSPNETLIKIAEIEKYCVTNGNAEGLIKVLFQKGKTLSELKKYRQSIAALIKGHDQWNESMNPLILNETLSLIIQNYKRLGDSKNAFKFQEELFIAKETLHEKQRSELSEDWRNKESQQKRNYENSLNKKGAAYNSGIEKLNLKSNILLGLSILFFLGLVWLSYLLLKTKSNINQITEKEIADKTRFIYEKNGMLIKTNDLLHKLIYAVSHDLKEPVRNLNSYSQLLQKKLTGEKNADLREYAHQINSSSIQFNNHLESIIEFSALTKSDVVSKQFVSLRKIVDLAIKSLDENIKKYNVKLEVETLPDLYINPKQFTLLFQHLFLNAIDNIDSNNPSIKINAKAYGDFQQVSVYDNGKGMDILYLESVFTSFNRLHSRKESNQSGMGLALCKQIIEKHGGKIWMESSLGEGTTVNFTIPKRKIS